MPVGGGMMGGPGGMAGELQSGLAPGSGLRSLPVNGYFYALNRQTGKVTWNSPVPHQHIVLEHFREMPIVMFTARASVDVMGRFRGNVNQLPTSFRSIDKRTGKLLMDEPEVSSNSMFHALNLDLRAGKIELLGQQVRITHYLPNYDAAAAKDKPAAKPQGSPTSSSGTSRRVGGGAIVQPVPAQVIEKR
jgi:hypothetical protein